MSITVPIDFELQIESALKQTNGLVDQINRGLGRVENSAKKAGFALNSIAVVELTRAAADLGRVLGDVFQRAISEAIEADNATQGLASALKASGGFSEQNMKAFEGLAKSLSEVSRFSDEAVLGAFKIGKQFGLSNRETAKFGKAAIELAAFLGEDLDTTARQLGQTFDGSIGRLGEQIPALRGLSEEALKAGGALDVILKIAGGSAARELDKFSVQIEKLKQAFGDIFEELGTSIVKNPAIINSLKVIGGLFRDIAVAVGNNDLVFRDFISGSLSAIVKGLFAVSTVIDFVNSGFYKLAKFLEPAVQALESFDKATEALKKGDIRGFTRSLDIMTATRDRFKEIDKMAERDAAGFEKFNNALVEVQAAIDRTTSSQKEFTSAVEETSDKFDDQSDKSTRGAETYLQMMARVKQAQQSSIDRLKKMVELEQEQIKRAGSDPIGSLFGEGQNKLKVEFETQKATAAIVGIASQVLNGKQGAVNLVAAGAEAAGKFFLGIPGFGDLAKLLSQGPEQIRAAINAFADAIPDVVVAIVESLPVVFETLADRLPDIIERIASKADKIAIALAKTMPLVAVALSRAVAGAASQFVQELISGAGKFIQALVDQIGEALGRLFDNLNPAKGVGGILGQAGGALSGSAIGSVVAGPVGGFVGAVGGGFGLFKGGGGGQSGNGPFVVKVQIGQRELAQAMVDLSKQGFRTT